MWFRAIITIIYRKMSYCNDRFSISDALKNSANYNWSIPSYQVIRENSNGMHVSTGLYYSASAPSSPSSSSFSSSFSSAGAQVMGKGRFAPY